MYYVYILKSISRNRYYIGYTANLHKRIEEHNIGCSRWTRNKGEWVLVYYEEFSDKGMA
ncbi:MAG TPA: nuclease [Candidatus Omnitrophica bacterium]|nr:nuclease [Candidatus Omnitrophota bacterium]